MRSQNPWAWLGLASLALPILVHLFSKRQARSAAFPTLRFLDVSRLLPTRRLQLSDVLLLLVRLSVLLFAVAALAQPLFNIAHAPSTTAIARVVVLDTTGVSADSAALAAARTQSATLMTGASNALPVESATPRGVLPGALSWLGAQPGRAELVIVSAFASGSLDSLDLAALPRDISVRLVARLAMRAITAAPSRGRVWWPRTAATAVAHDAILSAVRSLGAVAVTDSAATLGGAGRVIVVATPGNDSSAAWLRSARALDAPWMGDAVARLHGDTTLSAVAATVTLADSAVPAPFAVVSRTDRGVPVVLAASLTAPGGGRLLLVSRAPLGHLTTASLLLAAARVLTLPATASDASTASVAPTDAQLRAWEHAPAAAPLTRSVARGDYDVGSSDARYFWLVVLLLLGVETLLRRRTSAAAPASVTS